MPSPVSVAFHQIIFLSVAGKTFTYYPKPGKVFARCSESTSLDVQQTVSEAASAQKSWGSLPPAARANVILDVATALEKDASVRLL